MEVMELMDDEVFVYREWLAAVRKALYGAEKSFDTTRHSAKAILDVILSFFMYLRCMLKRHSVMC